MASMATLFVNTPYLSHSFPKPSSAHFAHVLKLSTHLGSKSTRSLAKEEVESRDSLKELLVESRDVVVSEEKE
ncbi:hypothetical protein ACFX2I_001180 [Malus domestica]